MQAAPCPGCGPFLCSCAVSLKEARAEVSVIAELCRTLAVRTASTLHVESAGDATHAEVEGKKDMEELSGDQDTACELIGSSEYFSLECELEAGTTHTERSFALHNTPSIVAAIPLEAV